MQQAFSVIINLKMKEDIKVRAPDAGNGYRADINEVLRNLNVRYRRTADDDWVATRESGDTIRLAGVKIAERTGP